MANKQKDETRNGALTDTLGKDNTASKHTTRVKTDRNREQELNEAALSWLL